MPKKKANVPQSGDVPNGTSGICDISDEIQQCPFDSFVPKYNQGSTLYLLSMMATMGYITVEIKGKLPGVLSPFAGLKVADISYGLCAIAKKVQVPENDQGYALYVLFVLVILPHLPQPHESQRGAVHLPMPQKRALEILVQRKQADAMPKEKANAPQSGDGNHVLPHWLKCGQQGAGHV